MSAERIERKTTIGVPQDRQGQVRSWSEMSQILDPLGCDPTILKFARTYFRVQKLAVEGKNTRARETFRSMERRFPEVYKRYQDFEDENPTLLSFIDIAVRGKSRWNDNK